MSSFFFWHDTLLQKVMHIPRLSPRGDTQPTSPPAPTAESGFKTLMCPDTSEYPGRAELALSTNPAC